MYVLFFEVLLNDLLYSDATIRNRSNILDFYILIHNSTPLKSAIILIDMSIFYKR